MQRSERTKGPHGAHRAFSSNRRHRRTCGAVHQSYLKLLPLKASRKTRIHEWTGLMQHRIATGTILTADVSGPNAHDFLFEAHRDGCAVSASAEALAIDVTRIAAAAQVGGFCMDRTLQEFTHPKALIPLASIRPDY